MQKFTILLVTLICFQICVSSQSCLPEGISFDTQEQIDNFQNNYPGCTEIEGSVSIDEEDDPITNLNGLSVLTAIGGTLTIWWDHHLANLSGLDNLTTVGGNVEIWENFTLNSLSGLNNLSSIGGYLDIWTNKELTSLEGLENLTSVGNYLLIWDNDALTNFEGLGNLSSVGGEFEIWENNALTNLSGLNNLSSIGGLDIYDNNALTSLSGFNILTSIGGQLWIDDNDNLTSLSGMENLTSIECLQIENNDALISLSGLDNIDAGSIQDLYIFENALLSTCNIKSVCNYLVNPIGDIEIYDNANGCNSQAEVKTACDMSVEYIEYGNEICIFPNPFSEKTTIKFTNPNHSDYKLSVFCISGNKVFEQDNIKSDKIEFKRGKLPKGVYLIELKGEKVFRSKIVVK
ncbi:MAG: T9SS type A sorting domain-containing protein [Bacteroidetes bacterium]|nr:T9SS type A sorting domain-containing protein [Bacteroidota bacterium]